MNVKKTCNEYEKKLDDFNKKTLFSLISQHYSFRYHIDQVNKRNENVYDKVFNMFIYIGIRYNVGSCGKNAWEVISNFQQRHRIIYKYPNSRGIRGYKNICQIIENDPELIGDLKSILAKIYFGWMDNKSL